MKGIGAMNESGLRVGTECATQTVVEAVFGEHRGFLGKSAIPIV